MENKKQMVKTKTKLITTVVSSVLLLGVLLTNCDNANNKKANNSTAFSSYRNIPNVTEEEIAAIEAFREQGKTLIYGMMVTSEAFEDESGQIKGYAPLFGKWLSEFLDIPFETKLYDWTDLVAGLESGQIALTSELSPTPERMKKYFMSDAIASRTLSYFRIADSKPLTEIAKHRPVRLVFLENAATIATVSPHLDYEFEVLQVDNFNAVYKKLKSGEADAFIEENVSIAAFDVFGDVVVKDFFPMFHIPVLLATRNAEFAPIVSIVTKALRNSGITQHFTELYNAGQRQYLKHKLNINFTEEERAYMRDNPVIPVAAEHYNYPISFYNKYEHQWQGVFFDVLQEMEWLTDLSFKLINDNKASWPVLMALLENGDAFMLPELIPTEERRDKGFIWPDVPTMMDKYALLSKSEFPNISLRDVFSVKVALPRGTAYTELFQDWFPEHQNTVFFESASEAFAALEHNEVDVVMSSQRRLLAITNHHEYPGYKANLVFDKMAESYFGFNKDHIILAAIFNKAFSVIDIGSISEQWALKTYDYKGKLAQEQRPWLIGVSFLLLCVLILVVVVFLRERGVGKKNLRAAVARAEAANSAKSTFLASMSHEIRTPMNAILSITEILQQDDDLSPKTENELGKIYSSCHLLLGIINDILDFSKIEAGKLDMMPAEYSVASMISDSVQLNVMRLESKPIEFEVNVDENVPAQLIGDELRIKQILNNLLSNAFKYTERGNVTLSIDFTDSCLNVSVSDTGCGMTQEQLAALFAEYVRFQRKTGRTIEGTGLGLPITQRLINLMSGEIKVESEYGKGTVFVVRLPQQVVDDKVLGKDVVENLKRFRMSLMNTAKRAKITREPMPYGKILVVDDVETNLYVAVGLMKLYRLQIDTAVSGIVAIEKIKSGKVYDIVFMDHMMPEMDGIEATKHLRDLGYTNPIVALTANAVAGQADVFLRNGFDDFIAKPIDTRQLNSVLNKLVRDKHPDEAGRLAKNETHSNDSSNINSNDIHSNDIHSNNINSNIHSNGIHSNNNINSNAINSNAQNTNENVEEKIPTASIPTVIPTVATVASTVADDDAYSIELPKTSTQKSHILDKNIAGLNIPKGLQRYNDDVAMYLKVLRLYTTNIGSMLNSIEVTSKDKISDYEITVHGIKGASFDIFAEQVGQNAKDLEMAAKSGDYNYIELHHSQFLETARGLISELEKTLTIIEAENPKPKKDKPDFEVLSNLLTACKVYDMDGADAAMEEIEEYQYTADDGLANWLRENIDMMNFAQIVQKLSQLNN